MNSIRGFSRTLSKFCTILYGLFEFWEPILGNTSWWLLLYILEALVFHNTSKWILSSLSNRAVFFSEYFNLKNYQKKKHVPSFSFPWWEGIPLLLFIMFSWLRLRRHSPKTFLYWRNLKILISLKRLSALTIIYIKLIYIKSSFTFE